MPRIDFEHPEITEWYNKANGEGSSTFDLCNECFDTLETAEDFDEKPEGYNGDPIPPDAKVEDILTPHPDIDEAEYKCENCKCKLTSDNYYN
jgi:hypothetical protein